MKKNLLVAFLTLFGLAVQAQDFDNYSILRCSGSIPEEVLVPSSKKYEQAIADLAKSEQKEEGEFHLQSNFIIDDLLQSGMVLFNDPVSKYVQEVANKVLEANPSYPKDKNLRFYVVRSAYVNAFATNQGIIFVNMGLLAQLENEAQLAFILSHEMVHVREGHALDLFLEAKDISKKSNSTDIFNDSRFNEQILAKNRYSQKLETEADLEGLDLYLNTDYNLKELDGVFDVLQYAHLPIDEVVFEQSFFETPYMKFPKSYLPAVNSRPIGSIVTQDDEQSTHPSVEKRRADIQAQIANKSGKAQLDFVVSKERFLHLRKVARYELSYYYLRSFRFEEAIYNSFILLKENPNSRYLRKIVAKSLYGRAKMGGVSGYDDTYLEGELHQLYYFFKQLPFEQHQIVALRYAWDALQLFPEDKELKQMVRDLALDLTEHYPSFAEFKVVAPNQQNKTNNSAVETEQDTSKELSKYDKIKQKTGQTAGDTVANDQFWRYAFVDIADQEKLQKCFDRAIEDRKAKVQDDAYYASSEWIDFRRKINKKGHFLDIDSVVIINPIYTKIRTSAWSNKTETMHLESEKQRLVYLKSLNKITQSIGLSAPVLDIQALKPEDTETFNDIVVLNEWFGQQLNSENSDMTGTDQETVDRIAQKYGTKFFAWGGVLTQRVTVIGVSHQAWYFLILFNVENGAYEVVKYQYIKGKDNSLLLQAHVYDSFFQVKRFNKKMLPPEEKKEESN